MKSGEFKAVFHLPALTKVLLSLASQGSKSYMLSELLEAEA